jgi:heme/copper-type cytochrome/quinol oxidase subunit 4
VPNKRKPSPHQKQIRFFTILFGALLIALVVGLLWVINRVSTPHP